VKDWILAKIGLGGTPFGVPQEAVRELEGVQQTL